MLRVTWSNKRGGNTIDLTGWIATGGDILKPLSEEAIFARAAVANYGAAVAWDDGDLAIDAMHLKKLAEEQAPFTEHDARIWQRAIGVSNNEAADLLGLSASTWLAYKAGSSAIPAAIAMLCRAIQRDPLLMQAHFRPRPPAGRPRSRAKAS